MLRDLEEDFEDEEDTSINANGSDNNGMNVNGKNKRTEEYG